MSMPAEPAIRSYFFRKGYVDLAATIAESWRLNLAAARLHFDRAGTAMAGQGAEKALAAFFGAAGISVVLFGTALFLAASFLHIFVLFAFLLLIYYAFSLILVAERGYLLGRGFFTVCPACHSKESLPVYFCPVCSAAHRRLIPSSYGILWRTCTCGNKLPTTFFLNRDRLQSSCASCGHLLKEGHFLSRKAFVPVLGGPSVGKSAFLFSALGQLLDKARSRGLVPSFVETRTGDEYLRVSQALERGDPPAKTINALPHALNVELAAASGEKTVLYLYDPAGEAFTETDGLALQKYQGFLSGVVLMVDPFAAPAVREEYRSQIGPVISGLMPSGIAAEDALGRFFIGMERNFGLAKGARMALPVAVVVSKADAFDLPQRLALGDHRLSTSATVRDALVKWEMGDIVQQIETRCANVRYFSCSALGRIPDGVGRAFEPQGVLQPLEWVLGASVSAFADPTSAPSTRRSVQSQAAGIVLAGLGVLTILAVTGGALFGLARLLNL